MSKLPRNHNRNHRWGASLIELVISVLVLGILAAVAAPVYSTSLLKYRVELAAQRITQDVLLAQRAARQTNSNCTIAFDLNSDNYSISGLTSLDRASQAYLIAVNSSPYNVDIATLATASQPSTALSTVAVVFNRFGMPDQGASITVRAGTFDKRIDIAPISGRVTVQ